MTVVYRNGVPVSSTSGASSQQAQYSPARIIASALHTAGIPANRASFWLNGPVDLPSRDLRQQALLQWAYGVLADQREGAVSRFEEIVREEVAAMSQPASVGLPGTELKAMFTLLKIPGCRQCDDLAKQMDVWGVDGCRQRRLEIVQGIRARQRLMGYVGTLKAASMAVVTGMAFTADLGDLPGWFVDEAIRRAAEKEAFHQRNADAAKEREKAAESGQTPGGEISPP